VQSVERLVTCSTKTRQELVPKGQDFSPLQVGILGSRAHSSSYPMGTGVLYLGSKRQGHETDTS
jgi:hypothetical protein